MTLQELCTHGTDELTRMALDGEITPKHLWVAMSGASAYRKAVARGDVADDDEARRRVSICAGCLSRQDRASTRMDRVVRLWCGEPFENRRDAALPTCGCLVGITIDGAAHAGGLTVVQSEGCPQGRW